MSIVFEDRSEEVLAALQQAKERALEIIGLKAEGYAKKLTPVDTGDLRGSISHAVNDDDVYIGTNCEYAIYQEMGTGKYYPGGRTTPWVYKDGEGKYHRTSGNPPHPFLKPAVTEHTQTYKGIIEKEFKNG